MRRAAPIALAVLLAASGAAAAQTALYGVSNAVARALPAGIGTTGPEGPVGSEPVYFRSWEQKLQEIESEFLGSLPATGREADPLTTGSISVQR